LVLGAVAPDLFRAVGLLSVPFIARGPMRPSAIVMAVFGDKIFYRNISRRRARPSASLSATCARALLATFYSLSGDAAPNERWRYAFERGKKSSTAWWCRKIFRHA